MPILVYELSTAIASETTVQKATTWHSDATPLPTDIDSLLTSKNSSSKKVADGLRNQVIQSSNFCLNQLAERQTFWAKLLARFLQCLDTTC